MDGHDLMCRLARVLDAHDWAALPTLLHDRFICRFAHSGESFDRATWVRLNAEYPGFERFTLIEVVAAGNRAVGRAQVTSRTDGELHRFEVASFIAVEDDLIVDMTEIWADVPTTPPERRV